MHDRQPTPSGFGQLWVGGGHRGADDQQRRQVSSGCPPVAVSQQAGDGGSGLLLEDPHAVGVEPFQPRAGTGIGAAHHKAPLRQDRCQGGHADTPGPDEVERLTAIELRDQGGLQASLKITADPPSPLYEILRFADRPIRALGPRERARTPFLYDRQPKSPFASGFHRFLP